MRDIAVSNKEIKVNPKMLTMLIGSLKEEIHVPITTTTAIISKELSNF